MFSPDLGVKSKIKVPVNSFPGEGTLLGLQVAKFYVLTWPSLSASAERPKEISFLALIKPLTPSRGPYSRDLI